MLARSEADRACRRPWRRAHGLVGVSARPAATRRCLSMATASWPASADDTMRIEANEPAHRGVPGRLPKHRSLGRLLSVWVDRLFQARGPSWLLQPARLPATMARRRPSSSDRLSTPARPPAARAHLWSRPDLPPSTRPTNSSTARLQSSQNSLGATPTGHPFQIRAGLDPRSNRCVLWRTDERSAGFHKRLGWDADGGSSSCAPLRGRTAHAMALWSTVRLSPHQ